MPRYLYSTVGLLLISGQLFSGTMATSRPPSDWSWIGALTLGPTWTNARENQTFYLTPTIEKSYIASKKNNTFLSGEFLGGIQKKISNRIVGELGLAIATTGNAKLQGVIWDDAEPEFENFTYGYKVRQTRVSLKGKLAFDGNFWCMPWVSGSVGVGFNRARSFKDTPIIYEAASNTVFQNHTKKNLVYAFGAGLQKQLSPHWQIGAGYELSSWGRSELGQAFAQTLNTGLELNTINANNILLIFTYST